MGMKLRQLRKQNGYRQSDISDIIGCERQALSQYENDKNKPSKEKLNKLAELYNVDINYLKYDEQNLGSLLEYRLVNEMGVRNLTEEELIAGAKTIYNKAYHDATAPTTGTLDELEYINEQNTSNYKKSKIGAYADLMYLIKTDVTQTLLNKFQPLFKKIISFEFGPRIVSNIEEEDI